MINLETIFQYLQNGEFETVINILDPIGGDFSMDIILNDRAILLKIIDLLNSYSLTLPENTADDESRYQASIQFGSKDRLARSENYDLIFRILRVISFYLSVMENPSLNSEDISNTLIDYLCEEENQAKGFYRNLLFQHFFSTHTSQFFNRLKTEPNFTNKVCRIVNPNYLDTGDCYNDESILVYAMRNGVSDAVFDALVTHGADVNGFVNYPSCLDNVQRHRYPYPFIRINPFDHQLNGSYTTLRPQSQCNSTLQLNCRRKSPLIEAIMNGNLMYFNRLLQSEHILLTAVHENLNGNPNPITLRNMSPLMLASYLGRLDMVKALIARGANINEVDHYGESAIFYAMRANQKETFLLLLKQEQLDPNVRNQSYRTFLDYIYEFNNRELQQLVAPVDRFRSIFLIEPQLLLDYLCRMIDEKMFLLIDDINRYDIVSYLSLIDTVQSAIVFHPLQNGGPLEPEERLNGYQNSFITMFSNHLHEPFICSGEKDSQYVVMQSTEDKFQIRYNPFSVEKAYHILRMAHIMSNLANCPYEILFETYARLFEQNFINEQNIFDLFESPEIAVQFLVKPDIVHYSQP
jgi:hypothetical protein